MNWFNEGTKWLSLSCFPKSGPITLCRTLFSAQRMFRADKELADCSELETTMLGPGAQGPPPPAMIV